MILEINAFANPYPDEAKEIETYIAECLKKENPEIIKEYELESFEVKVLNFKRTFVEKILSLGRLSLNDDDEYSELKEKVRHFYDVYKLLSTDEIKTFIDSSDFKEMIEQALQDDFSNPEFKDSWVDGDLREIRLFKEHESIFNKITPTYNDSFKSLLYDRNETSIEEVKDTFEFLSLIHI